MCSIRMRSAVVLATVLAAAGIVAASQASNAAISYRTPTSVVLNEPVVVEVRLSNQSVDTLHVDLGFDRKTGFAVSIKSPDGVVHTPRIVVRDVVRGGRLTLEPGEELSHQLLLNDWLRFDQLGVYEVAMRLSEPMRTGSGLIVDAATATQFRVRVGPRDLSTLQQVCWRLADTIVNSGLAEDRLNAARALSFVADEVALPCVRHVLSATRQVDSILVEGLARISHPEARALLIELGQSDDRERAALSGNALRRAAIVPKGQK